MQKLPPYTLLQPEVWSRILSHLPPDEISQASKLISTTKNNSNQQQHQAQAQHQHQHHGQNHTMHQDQDQHHHVIRQDSSRIAVESMIQRAVQYCRSTKHNTSAKKDDKPPPLFDSSNSMEIDSFLGTPIMTSSDSQELLMCIIFGKQDWWTVYNELYVVYAFLAPMVGFLGEDPNQTIAHAVYSVYMLRMECPAYDEQ